MNKRFLPSLLGLLLLASPTLARAQGTTNFVSKFVSPSTFGDSSLFDDGSIGFNTSSPGITTPGVPTFTLLNSLNPSILELATTSTAAGSTAGIIYFLDTSSTDGDLRMSAIQSTITRSGTKYGGSLFFSSKTLGGVATHRLTVSFTGNIGFSLDNPQHFVGLNGNAARTMGMDPNQTAGSSGNALTINAGDANAAATDKQGGDLVLATGVGTGLGGGGNARIQTAGAEDLSGTTGNTLIDREIAVGKAKQLTLSSPGFTSLMSIHLVGTHTAGGRIFYMVRATDGGSQIATEEGIIQYLATANSITCTTQTTDKLHLGTVNSGCTPGFFNPGSQPGISIFDNVSFSSPAPIVVHEVYFKVDNESGSPIRLEP